jgi:hypothetical protein
MDSSALRMLIDLTLTDSLCDRFVTSTAPSSFSDPWREMPLASPRSASLGRQTAEPQLEDLDARPLLKGFAIWRPVDRYRRALALELHQRAARKKQLKTTSVDYHESPESLEKQKDDPYVSGVKGWVVKALVVMEAHV